jgi:predicted dienelactone hydrolase
VYSHGGCGGSPKAIEPIATSLARDGFVFVQFPHPGSTADDCVSGGSEYAKALMERPDDIIFVLDELLQLDKNPAWLLQRIVNTEMVGIIGHSQGGQTALMMPARDRRVRAILAVSPSVAHPDSPPGLWTAIGCARVPVMIIHGERDTEWTAEGPLKAFDALPPDTARAYLEIAGMGHTPRAPSEVALIQQYARALFELYIKADARARSVLDPAAAPDGVRVRAVRFP